MRGASALPEQGLQKFDELLPKAFAISRFQFLIARRSVQTEGVTSAFETYVDQLDLVLIRFVNRFFPRRGQLLERGFRAEIARHQLFRLLVIDNFVIVAVHNEERWSLRSEVIDRRGLMPEVRFAAARNACKNF